MKENILNLLKGISGNATKFKVRDFDVAVHNFIEHHKSVYNKNLVETRNDSILVTSVIYKVYLELESKTKALQKQNNDIIKARTKLLENEFKKYRVYSYEDFVEQYPDEIEKQQELKNMVYHPKADMAIITENEKQVYALRPIYQAFEDALFYLCEFLKDYYPELVSKNEYLDLFCKFKLMNHVNRDKKIILPRKGDQLKLAIKKSKDSFERVDNLTHPQLAIVCFLHKPNMYDAEAKEFLTRHSSNRNLKRFNIERSHIINFDDLTPNLEFKRGRTTHLRNLKKARVLILHLNNTEALQKIDMAIEKFEIITKANQL